MKGRGMENDWLVHFNLSIEELRLSVESALYRTGMQIADEILGEVLLRLTRIIRADPRKFAHKTNILKYAHMIAANELKRQFRKERRRREVDPPSLADPVEEAPAVKQLPSGAQLLQALGHLNRETHSE